jgi:diaminopimelate epimerase
MQFYKYSGSGNDFIFIDNRQEVFRARPSVIVELCKRKEGIGADGVILIGNSKKHDFEMRIFNADGSEAEMCGNGARCSVHFAYYFLKLKDEKHFIFETMNGVYEGEVVAKDEVKIKMTELYDVDSVNINDLSGKRALYLNTGVPHAVIQVSSVEDVNIKAIGSAIRNDVRFPNGTNVDFFEVLNAKDQTIKLRVYERGVEDETLCCGTGVMATAISCAKFFNWSGTVNVYAKGGYLKAIVDTDLKNLFFQGEVKMLFQGEILHESSLKSDT